MSLQELSRATGLATRTLRQYCHRGHLAHTRDGQRLVFRAAAVEQAHRIRRRNMRRRRQFLSGQKVA